MNKRPRWVKIFGGLAIVAAVGAGLGYFLWQPNHPSPAEIYSQRFTKGYEVALSEMRKVLRQNPHDAETRYWLASLLIENTKDEQGLVEAISLLGSSSLAPANDRESQPSSRIDTHSPPSWIPLWSEARRLQIYGRGLALLTTEGSRLHREINRPEGDEQLKKFVADSLTELEKTTGRIAAVGSQLAAGPTKKEVLSGDEVREDLLALKNLLADRWAYVKEKELQTGKSLDDGLTRALNEVQPQMKLAEATDILRRFVAGLEDGHTHIGYMAPSFSLPFRVVETPQGLIIAQTSKPGLGIEVGDRLISVDNLPVIEAVQAQEQVSISSTADSRHAAAIHSLETHWNEQRGYQVAVERKGQLTTVELKTEMTHELPWSDGKRFASTPWITARTLAPSVAYLRVSTWWPPTQTGPMDEDRLAMHRSEIDTVMREVQSATDLVLDLRGNAGGSDSLCAYLASYYVPDPMQTYVLRYRMAPGVPRPEGSDGFLNPERLAATYPRHSGEVLKTKIWVLMDPGCFSATDTLLNILIRNIPDRVVTIGRPNGAGIGGPTLIGNLRNSGLPVTCSTCKAYSTDGELLEGRPVVVAHPVQWTQADIVAGIDPDLETALQLIGVARESKDGR